MFDQLRLPGGQPPPPDRDPKEALEQLQWDLTREILEASSLADRVRLPDVWSLIRCVDERVPREKVVPLLVLMRQLRDESLPDAEFVRQWEALNLESRDPLSPMADLVLAYFDLRRALDSLRTRDSVLAHHPHHRECRRLLDQAIARLEIRCRGSELIPSADPVGRGDEITPA